MGVEGDAEAIRGAHGVHGGEVVEEFGQPMQPVALECEQVNGTLSGLAVDAHIGDAIEPASRGGIHRAEVRDVESGEEVLLHVSDAGLGPAFLVTGADVARGDLEAVMTGEVGVAGMEHRRLADRALEHRGLQIVDHDGSGGARVEELEGVEVALEEVFEGLRDGELDVHHGAVAPHHDEEAQAAPGVAERDRAVVSPVDLGALAGCEVQGQESGGANRAHSLQVILDDGDAPVVTDLAQAVENLRGAVGIVLEQSADGGLERVELAGVVGGEPGAEARLVEPSAHGFHQRLEVRGPFIPGVDLTFMFPASRFGMNQVLALSPSRISRKWATWF